jgi:hypothetical protein
MMRAHPAGDDPGDPLLDPAHRGTGRRRRGVGVHPAKVDASLDLAGLVDGPCDLFGVLTVLMTIIGVVHRDGDLPSRDCLGHGPSRWRR